MKVRSEQGSPEGLDYAGRVGERSPEGLDYARRVGEGSPEGLDSARRVGEGSPEGLDYGRRAGEGGSEGLDYARRVGEGSPEGQDRARRAGGASHEAEYERNAAAAVRDVAPAVALEHITKSFGARKVLDDVSFAIETGKAFCLLGRSGTGKSVTLRHIIGLVRPDRGRVLVEGRDITSLDDRALSEVRKRMGFLFQNAALFDSMTVGENVAFPMRRHTRLPDAEIRERARRKLADVGLEHDIDKMPADLSGGMKKRAGLARAMALDPAILLVDEPSAGLDPITSAEIDQLLVERKRCGTTLVVVTHNIPSARVVADGIALLHDGRILAQGTVDELDRSSDPLVQAFMRSEGGG